MMKAEFDTMEEAEAFIAPMLEENKYAISAIMTKEGKVLIQWEVQKKYIAQDGQEFTDEIWMTKEGNLIHIQDLEPEHAKNIIRMMLRNERLAKARMEEYLATALDELAGQDIANPNLPEDSAEPRILH
jgi:hypothetical protein